MKISIPVNTVAEVFLPGNESENILEGGKPVHTADGVKFLRIENDRVVLLVGYG